MNSKAKIILAVVCIAAAVLLVLTQTGILGGGSGAAIERAAQTQERERKEAPKAEGEAEEGVPGTLVKDTF